MKSIVLRLMLVLAAFMAVPNAFAADTGGGNVFVDARFGAMFGRKGDSGNSTDDSTTSWGADGGYLWKLDDQRSLGFELGYTHFGKVSDFGGNFGRDQVSASAMTLGGHFQYLFGDDRAWIFQVRGGFASVKVDDDIDPTFGAVGTDSWHQTGVYVGLGIGRQIIQGFSVILAYSHLSSNASANRGGEADLNLNWIGLVAEYRFGD
jgi:OOP family OmpA-OmpF porin